MINFAKAGKRIWQNNHLVHRMAKSDFDDQQFISNTSIVAYLDGTGNGDTDSEVVGAITNSLPDVAYRFLKDDVYVGQNVGMAMMTSQLMRRMLQRRSMLIAPSLACHGCLISKHMELMILWEFRCFEVNSVIREMCRLVSNVFASANLLSLQY